MKILITGATGFIGRALTPHLASLGHQVTVLGRYPIDIKGVLVLQVPDITAVTEAHVGGQDVVIHLAGQAHDNAADESSYRHVNVIGTEAVTRSCVQADVQRLVYLSSIKVHGDSSHQPLDIASPTTPDDAYGRSKLEAENIVRAQSSLESVIVRIPLVYGSGVKGNFASLVKLANSGLPLPFKAVIARRSYLGIDNLIDLLARCVEFEAKGSEILYGADPVPVTLPQLLETMANAMNKPCRVFALPEPILEAMVRLLVGDKRANKLLGQLEVNIGGTTSSLGWRPPYSMEQCMHRMFGHPQQS